MRPLRVLLRWPTLHRLLSSSNFVLSQPNQREDSFSACTEASSSRLSWLSCLSYRSLQALTLPTDDIDCEEQLCFRPTACVVSHSILDLFVPASKVFPR